MKYLEEIASHLKPLNSAADLVDLGICHSEKTLANKRYQGTGPDFLRIKGTGIRYPKEAVLEWLQKSTTYISCQRDIEDGTVKTVRNS